MRHEILRRRGLSRRGRRDGQRRAAQALFCKYAQDLLLLTASESLAQGAPGLLALVPLMKGGSERAVVEEAARRLEHAFPGERLSDAEDVLLALAGRYYTVSELARIVGRDRMIQSSLYVEGRAEGRTEGEADGRLQSAREICAALARKYHPASADSALPLISECSDPARLEEWALAAPDLSDTEFLGLLRA